MSPTMFSSAGASMGALMGRPAIAQVPAAAAGAPPGAVVFGGGVATSAPLPVRRRRRAALRGCSSTAAAAVPPSAEKPLLSDGLEATWPARPLDGSRDGGSNGGLAAERLGDQDVGGDVALRTGEPAAADGIFAAEDVGRACFSACSSTSATITTACFASGLSSAFVTDTSTVASCFAFSSSRSSRSSCSSCFSLQVSFFLSSYVPSSRSDPSPAGCICTSAPRFSGI
mmetsp:Transcript_91513/g.296214  ORF Transcript_91513/g.296214 Transcript_91513/m.296214 type:complete len:228 (+) Transcript_91513:713-1396(+)